MIHRSVKLAVAVASCATAALLAGCAIGNPSSADDDSPAQNPAVTAETVGKLAVATMDESHAYTTSFAPAASASDHLGQNAGALSLQKNLAKAPGVDRSSEEISNIDSSDIANNRLTITATKQLLGCTVYDTMIVKASDPDVVIYMAETKVCAKMIESVSASDADGNGILAGPGEINGKATMVARVTYTDDYWGHSAGEVETAVYTASSGPDGDFDTENDNIVYEVSWVRMLGSDTLAYAEYIDADGDGYIIDNGSATPSVVDVVLYEKNPPFNYFVEYSRINMRLITDGNEENDKVIKLFGEEALVTGRVNSFVVLDHTNGDSIIEEGVIANAIFATVVSSDSDSIISSSAGLVFDPVSGLEDETDNLYYEIHLSHEKRFGLVRTLTYDFTTAEPVPEGGEPTSGHLEMFTEYANGKTASIVADFDASGFTGTYTAPDGSTVTVTWDSEGNVVSQNT